MPYTRSKYKTRKIKRKLKELNLKQKKQIMSRLMAISLKHDEYVYNNKPISIEEADMYAREMEIYRAQCHNEQYLQVIQKLTLYMQAIIGGQPLEILNENVIDPRGTYNGKRMNENEHEQYTSTVLDCNATVNLEMVRSLSNLSIEVRDMNDIYQKKVKRNEHVSVVTKNKVKNLKVAKIENNLTSIYQKRKEMVNNKLSKNTLNDSEQENSVKLDKYYLRNTKNKYKNDINYNDYHHRGVKNNRTQKELENTAGKIKGHVKNKNQYNVRNSEVNPPKDTIEFSQNLMGNYEYETYKGDVGIVNYINPQISQINRKDEIAYKNRTTINKISNNYSYENTGNIRAPLEDINNAVKQTNQTIDVVEINPTTYEPIYKNSTSNTAHTFTNNSNTNTILQNNSDLSIDQNNSISKMYQTHQSIETHYTSKDDTFTKSNGTQYNKPFNNDNVNLKTNKRKIKASNITEDNNIQNQLIKKVNKRRRVKKDIENAAKEGNRETHAKRNLNKNKELTFLKKKQEQIDMSWVENLKFVREIQTEEYVKYDNLKESFWTDLSVPSDIIGLADFENDNINVWKQ